MHVPGLPHALDILLTRPHEFSDCFNKKEEIAQNHIAVFSKSFYHILICIYPLL